jgi:hypothetical protein
MKRNHLFERARNAFLNPFILGLLVATLLIVSGNSLYRAGASNASANAAAETPPAEPVQIMRPWTAVASTGVVDESSINDFGFGVNFPTPSSDFGFRNGSQALGVLARYNVTNTFDNNANPNVPNWTTLELGGIAPGASNVTASLFRIERCSGRILPPPNQPANAPLCSVTITNQAAPTCRNCNFVAALVDFTQFLYVVEVKVSRPNAQIRPFAHTLRIF